MAFSDPLDAQLRAIGWTVASSRRWPSSGEVVPADPQDRDATVPEKRAGCLVLLRAHTRMIKILQRRIDITASAAHDYGASYAEVGAACGVSRQAARQRWLRRPEHEDLPGQPDAGGPSDPGAAPLARSARGAATAADPQSDRANLPAKVRVYELAADLHVESKDLMVRLQEMGEFIRSASSTLEPRVVRQLRDESAVQLTSPAKSEPQGG